MAPVLASPPPVSPARTTLTEVPMSSLLALLTYVVESGLRQLAALSRKAQQKFTSSGKKKTQLNSII